MPAAVPLRSVVVMDSQHIDTLIIGAGQAGLSTGQALREHGIPFLIVDAADRIGDGWRHTWDSLKLYTPAGYDGLPGLPFPAADPWHFPGKDEVADYLESYALHHDLPVRLGTRIARLTTRTEGGFVATLEGDGGTITCRAAVIATGTFGRTPQVPDAAADLNPDIRQLHSSEYRRPGQLEPGLVLVVGASHSGMDVAYDVASRHPTILCGRDCGSLPVRWEGRSGRLFIPVMIAVFRHVLTRRTPLGRREMGHERSHGSPSLRIKPADLETRGVERTHTRFTGTVDGRPQLSDGRVIDAASVVWCTGFRQVFDWIDIPGVIGPDGWPREYRGVVSDVPGLFFCGLSFQYAMSSMILPGVGRDAAYVGHKIATGNRQLSPVAA